MSNKRRQSWPLSRRSLFGCAGLAVSITVGSAPLEAFAQSSPSPSRVVEEGLRRQQARDGEQQRALQPRADVLSKPQPRKRFADLPTEAPCFVIDDITLEGPGWLRMRWLLDEAKPHLHQCIGARGIAQIAADLDASLVDQGYVTSRVSVGPQSLSAGRIVFQLHTGRISEVRLVNAEDKALDTRWGTWVNAFPTSPGRRLDARDLEQGVEQMKRLPSQTVVTTLTPGLEPETSVLTIERQTGGLRDRIRGGLTLDNSGGAALGRAQLSANVAVDNPLGLNDIAGLSFNGNAENPHADHRSQSASFSYSVPLGYSLFSANLSHSRFAQFIQLTTTRALSSGDSASVDFRWDHVAWRTASTKTGVWLDLSTRKARSYLDDTELLVQRRQTTSFEIGANFKALFANGASLDFSVGHRRGLPWLDAGDDLPASAGGLTLRPSVWTSNVSASFPFSLQQDDRSPGAASPRNGQYSANLHVQTTSDRTTAIDQIAIGNRSSVRGFDGDAVLLAESGWTLRNELSTPLHAGPVEAVAYAGLDYGRVWGPSSADLPGHNLAGAALGLRGRWKALQTDLALAVPIVKPKGLKTAGLSAYLSITCAF